jgi:hypothetical protein
MYKILEKEKVTYNRCSGYSYKIYEECADRNGRVANVYVNTVFAKNEAEAWDKFYESL